MQNPQKCCPESGTVTKSKKYQKNFKKTIDFSQILCYNKIMIRIAIQNQFFAIYFLNYCENPVKEAKPMENLDSQQTAVSSAAVK